MREATVVFIGEGGVGKSSIVARLMDRKSDMKFDPTIEDAYDSEWTVNGETIIFHFYDTSGQEEYKVLVEQAVISADIVVVVCDIADPSTLKPTENRIVRVREIRKDCPDLPVLLVCNKIDKEIAEEDEKTANKLALRKNIDILMTSALGKGKGIIQLQQRLMVLAPIVQTKRKCCNLI